MPTLLFTLSSRAAFFLRYYAPSAIIADADAGACRFAAPPAFFFFIFAYAAMPLFDDIFAMACVRARRAMLTAIY